METNKEIRELLRKKRGDLKDFASFLKMSVVGLLQKLESEKKKDNLSGMYREFVINQKKRKK